MVEGFVTWGMIAGYTTLVGLVFMIVEFTKNFAWTTKIKTKYYSALIAFVLILLGNLHGATFVLWDLVLYVLSAISISLTANGLSDFNNPVDKSKQE